MFNGVGSNVVYSRYSTYVGRLVPVRSNQPKITRGRCPGIEFAAASYRIKSQSKFRKFTNKILAIFRMESPTTEPRFTLSPPVEVRGMLNLDKQQFSTRINVPAIKVPIKAITKHLKLLRYQILKIQKLKSVIDLAPDDSANTSYKYILLDHRKIEIADGLFSFETGTFPSEYNKVYYADVNLGYENFSSSEVLDAILPQGSNVSSFETIGHIAHLNLKEELIPYKEIIGEVILEKTPNIRTVVNKLNIIDNTYRNFKMEVLAGDVDFITNHKENGCLFRMDYSKVYWNSRLGNEHDRITKGIETDAIVFDVFAGIGPFSVPLAKQGCVVYANDLNPDSYFWLTKNVKLNKIRDNISVFNMDGRDFLTTVVREKLITHLSMANDTEILRPIHIIMNLPALAINFLDTFNHLLPNLEELKHVDVSLKVHCYCFATSDGNPIDDIQQRLRSRICLPSPDKCVFQLVRHVAPNKDMYCVTFDIDEEILLSQESDFGSDLTRDTDEPSIKHVKLEKKS